MCTVEHGLMLIEMHTLKLLIHGSRHGWHTDQARWTC